MEPIIHKELINYQEILSWLLLSRENKEYKIRWKIDEVWVC